MNTTNRLLELKAAREAAWDARLEAEAAWDAWDAYLTALDANGDVPFGGSWKAFIAAWDARAAANHTSAAAWAACLTALDTARAAEADLDQEQQQ